MKRFIGISLYFWMVLLGISGSFAQDMELYRDADILLYSGEVTWNMDYEAFQPAPKLDADKKPVGLSDKEFEAWNVKQAGYRKQSFKVHVIFQGDNLRFECQSEAGDVSPTKLDQVVTYNGVSITFIDNVLANLYREPVAQPYLEHHMSKFYISPRTCGYAVNPILKMAREVKDGHEEKAADLKEYVDTQNGNAVVLDGIFADGSQKIAEFVPDEQFGQVMKSTKYICPAFKDRISIECSDFKSFSDGTVYPNKAVVSHYVGGLLNDLKNAYPVDRITLTLVDAKFNGKYDDEFFNPGCPEGYTDLKDLRSMLKSQLEKK